MGAVIEKASGMPFDTFVQTRIFDPLKMTSSYWTVPASEVGRFATNYVIMGDSLTPFDSAATSVYLHKPSFPFCGAFLFLSARVYFRFLLSFFLSSYLPSLFRFSSSFFFFFFYIFFSF